MNSTSASVPSISEAGAASPSPKFAHWRDRGNLLVSSGRAGPRGGSPDGGSDMPECQIGLWQWHSLTDSCE
eukprot:747752-Hanusia_phi.AAC.1